MAIQPKKADYFRAQIDSLPPRPRPSFAGAGRPAYLLAYIRADSATKCDASMLRKLTAFAAFAIGLSPVRAQQPGVVADTVWCRNHPRQSYALYLPAGYSTARTWPVVYMFDPAAQGAQPLRRYQGAADAYGFILAGSNSSANGALESSLDAARVLRADIESRYSVNKQRLYTSGFSGGSRVASAVAMLTEGIVGVAGCGAGLPDLPPSVKLPAGLAYAGLVGLDDSNYGEMLELRAQWRGQHTPHTLLVFDGGHDWPPASTFGQALEWLELQASKAGQRDKQPDGLTAYFQKRLAAARAIAEPLAAWEAYEQLRTDFAGLLDVAAAREGAEALARKPELQRARQQQRTILQRDSSWQRETGRAYYQALATRAQPGTAPDAAGWRSRAAAVQQLRQSSNPAEQHLGNRQLHFLRLLFDSQGEAALANQDFWAAVTTFRLWTLVEPGSAAPYYQLAAAYALEGQSARAFKALEQARTQGFSSRAELERNPAFRSLRVDKRYQKLLASLPEKP
ncbi:hypothetical protein GCM10023185_29430 [Hymenobacter saemangeumensis]|uniref:Alpha/beta hydrolase n=1 Tax=Hymenobacter saemangeumensis TaxID=1084522 RepID=A0ABP8IKY9_9BACT